MHITITSAGHLHEIQTRHILKGIVRHVVGLLCWDPFLESPDNFLEPKSRLVFAVFAFNIKSFNNSENDTMKLQRLINEAKLTCL